MRLRYLVRMNVEREFASYRTEERLEIQAMANIIESLPTDFTDKERDLLLRSFIVLVYAYWESCYHKIQEVVFEKFEDIYLEKLPFEIKNKVYLAIVQDKAGANHSKEIREVKDYNLFHKINSGIIEKKESKLSDFDTISIKKKILNKSGNPNFEDLKKFMASFNIRLDRIIESNISEGNLAPYFTKFLTFIIKQRNAIAHKNEKIQHEGSVYRTYFECLESVTELYSTDFNNVIDLAPADFVKEMLFQIDKVFTILIESVEEKRGELNRNVNNNN